MREIIEVPALDCTMRGCKGLGRRKDIPSCGIEALDELLDLPHLNVLLRSIVLRHFG